MRCCSFDLHSTFLFLIPLPHLREHSPQSPVCQSAHSLILQASAEGGLKVISHADSSFNTREYFIEKQPTYRSLSPSPHVREHGVHLPVFHLGQGPSLHGIIDSGLVFSSQVAFTPLRHSTTLCLYPFSQVTEHLDHSPVFQCGHCPKLQRALFVGLAPGSQVFGPPSHSTTRSLNPSPQEDEHCDHSATLHCGQTPGLQLIEVCGLVLGLHLFSPALHLTLRCLRPSPQVTEH